MLQISWKEYKTNEFVRGQVEDHTSIGQKIDQNKHQFFDHVSRRNVDNLDKIIVHGQVDGHRRRGRQKL